MVDYDFELADAVQRHFEERMLAARDARMAERRESVLKNESLQAALEYMPVVYGNPVQVGRQTFNTAFDAVRNITAPPQTAPALLETKHLAFAQPYTPQMEARRAEAMRYIAVLRDLLAYMPIPASLASLAASAVLVCQEGLPAYVVSEANLSPIFVDGEHHYYDPKMMTLEEVASHVLSGDRPMTPAALAEVTSVIHERIIRIPQNQLLRLLSPVRTDAVLAVTKYGAWELDRVPLPDEKQFWDAALTRNYPGDEVMLVRARELLWQKAEQEGLLLT